jgi:hypothetical protein
VFDEEIHTATLSTIAICAKGLRDRGRHSYFALNSTQLLEDVGGFPEEEGRKELAAWQI